MTAIKICGMKRAVDVELALELGVQYVGLVLAESPRQLTIDQAARLADIVRAGAGPTRVVLLVRNQAPAFVDRAIAAVRPDLLQFHGDESESQCRRHGMPYWKAVACGTGPETQATSLSLAIAGHESAQALVLDGHAPGQPGGSGRTLDWARWPHGSRRRLVLAGGLTVENVAAAVARTRPYAVDVASGLEQAPGIKDHGRMRAFIAAVRGSA